MKVFFDYQIFSLQKYGGISRYFFELMNHFSKSEEINFELPIYFSNNQYLRNAEFVKVKSFFPNLKLGIKNYYTRYLNSINFKMSVDFANNQNYDVMHPTYYNSYFLKSIKKKPYVITVHDLTYEKFPNLLKNSDTETKREIYNSARKIIAVSQNTKEDLLKFYKIKDEKICVIYHGNSLLVNNDDLNNRKIDLPEKYLLFVGKRNNYKNFLNFVKTISPLMNEDRKLFVVCAGDEYFKPNEKKIFHELNIVNQIKHIKIDNDIQLIQLYKSAIAFVYPSLYEGFGIPILEAFACDCPVIASNNSSLPEIAIDAAIYFDPQNNNDMREKISEVIRNIDIRNQIINRGRKRLEYFSWQKTANETKKVYESVI
ncbi:MAG: glycosyltransferase family 4 protein [Ignavibacteriae bacterium]|nr:glycosyltransferase family 4 protein [Ignavibacteriota bacterium]